MHSKVATAPAAASVSVPTLAYIAKQAFLWLAVPLAFYLVFVSQIPALHNPTHAARHAAGWLKCH